MVYVVRVSILKVRTIKKLRNAIKAKYPNCLFIINESGTSSNLHCCQTKAKHPTRNIRHKKTGKLESKPAHGTVLCTTKNKCFAFKDGIKCNGHNCDHLKHHQLQNRDLSGVIGIAILFLRQLCNLDRPTYMKPRRQ